MKVHKPEDIEVGTVYNHPEMMGYRFLGIGRRKLFTEDKFVEKHLVVLSTPTNKGIGMMMQEWEDAWKGLWEIGFRTKDDEDSYYIVKTKIQ